MTRLRRFSPLASVALLLALAFPAAVAHAHDGDRKGRHARAFERLDQDADGALSRDEVAQARGQRFARFDADGDGILSRDEFLAPRRPGKRTDRADFPKEREERFRARREARFARLDADADGGIDREEFEAGGGVWFARLDVDADGRLTREELRAGRKRR